LTGPRLLVPLALEAVPIRRGAPALVIERIGMGPSRAKQATARIIGERRNPQPMVLLGVAGGLNHDDRPGDIIVATSLMTIDFEDEIVLGEAASIADLLSRERMSVRRGSIVSTSTIIHGETNRRHAGRNGALAVDMESYWCGPLAAHHPFVVVRVLLDVPGIKLRSPAVVSAARDTYRALRAVARTLAQWSPVSVDRYPLSEVGES